MAGERGFALLVRATRAKALPVTLVPVVVASVLAWSRHGAWSWPRFVIALVGAGSGVLASHVVTDLLDEDAGVEDAARRDHRSLATGSGVLGAGAMSRGRLLALAAALGAVAAGAWLWLSSERTVAVAAAGIAGAVVAAGRSAPPLRYGHRVWGDVGVFAGYGLLPAVAAYGAQAGVVDAAAWWGGATVALLVAIALYHEHFLHWRSDREAGKRTAVAALGPEAGVALGRILALTFAIVVSVQSLVSGLWPPGGAAAALALTPVAVAHNRALEEPELGAWVRLLGAALGAAVLGGAILTASLVIRVALR